MLRQVHATLVASFKGQEAWGILDADGFGIYLKQLLEENEAFESDFALLEQELSQGNRLAPVDFVGQVAADFRRTLELLLLPHVNRECVSATRRRIKYLVLQQEAHALRHLGPLANQPFFFGRGHESLEEMPLFNHHSQAFMLDEAVRVLSRLGRGEVFCRHTPPQEGPSLALCQIPRQSHKKELGYRVNGARQAVIWIDGRWLVQWVHFSDYMFRSEVIRQKDATDIWNNQCFGPDVFLVRGVKMTQAEAIAKWCNEGYSFSDSVRYWKSRAWDPLLQRVDAEGPVKYLVQVKMPMDDFIEYLAA